MSIGHVLTTKDMRVAAMIEATKSSVFAEPLDTLRSRLSLCKRQQSRQQAGIDNVWCSPSLKQWSFDDTSCALIVHASFPNRAAVSNVGTMMAQFVRDRGLPILFALQPAKQQSRTATGSVQILKYLTMQAMKLSADSLDALVTQDFNATRLQSATTQSQWQQILARVIRSHAIMYIMVDLDLLREDGVVSEVTGLLCTIFANTAMLCTGTTLKIILLRNKRMRKNELILPNTRTLNLDRILADGPTTPRSLPTSNRSATAFRSRLGARGSSSGLSGPRYMNKSPRVSC